MCAPHTIKYKPKPKAKPSTIKFIGGSKGGRQGRAPPPGGPNSFIFMQFSAKN